MFHWGYLIHLGYNLWLEQGNPRAHGDNDATDYLRCQRPVWDRLIAQAKASGVNTLVIDVAEGMIYPSHPELAVKGSWTAEAVYEEVQRLKDLGFTVIPKLNFATSHDVWMGEYSRMVSTGVYYRVCADLIADVCRAFDHPAYFHLGLDEEDIPNQKNFQYAVLRQHELWWHDFYFYVDECAKWGARPILWSDYAIDAPERKGPRNDPGVNRLEDYLRRMPKDVIQNNWYYWNYWDVPGDYILRTEPKYQYDEAAKRSCQGFLDTFHAFEKAGLTQWPAASVWHFDENLTNLSRYVRQVIGPEYCFGLMQTPWAPTMESYQSTHDRAMKELKRCRAEWEEHASATEKFHT